MSPFLISLEQNTPLFKDSKESFSSAKYGGRLTLPQFATAA